MQELQRLDRHTWRRYLFYIDLVVIGIFAVSLILLVRHTYHAGQYRMQHILQPEQGAWGLHSEALWAVVADTALLVGSMMWIFYRFFRNEYLVMTRRF